jgi:hypothetical protein
VAKLNIKNKRSKAVNKAPSVGDLTPGEIGVNYNAASPALYIEDDAGNVVKIAGAGSVGGTQATEAAVGVAEIATQAETDAGTDDTRIVTPLKLATAVGTLVPAASETAAGKIEIATQAEVTTGTDDTRAITPLKLKQATDALPPGTTVAATAPLAPEAGQAFFDTTTNTLKVWDGTAWRTSQPTATETVAGIAEVATQAEVTAGTDDTRIVTPLKLATSANWKSDAADVYPAVATKNVKIGGTLPATPKISLNADGTASFAGDQVNVDSSGRLLVGTSSTSAVCKAAFVGSSGSAQSIIHIGRSATVTNGSALGLVAFGDSSQNVYAQISASADAAPGANDYPGRLVFSTTADGASSPTERLRIDSSGRLLVGTSSTLAGATDSLLQIRGNSSGTQFAGKVALATDVAAGSIVSGTDLGAIYFGNVANGIGGLIECKGDAQWGTNDYPGRLVFSTTADGASFPTERVRIDGSGRLLVGTSTAPSFQQFQVANTGGENIGAFRFSNNGASSDIAVHKSRGSLGVHSIVSNNDGIGSLAFRGSDGSAYKNVASISAFVDGTPGANNIPGRLVFSTTSAGMSTPTERMRIDSSGNVLVGGTLPASPNITLSAVGSADFGSNLFLNTNGVRSGSLSVISIYDGSGKGAGPAVINLSANKENITPANPQLADVVALGKLLKNYDWNEDAPLNEEIRSQRQLGLIAQEAEKVSPGLVKTIKRTKQGKS